MTEAVATLIAIAAIFAGVEVVYGFHHAYSIALGSISVMAMIIAGTFLWLWRRRETPLALGMSFSWAGAASLLGWWWLFHVLRGPVIMAESTVIFIFLSLYFVGAVQHFAVVRRSLGGGLLSLALPVLAAVALAALGTVML